jgi:leucine-zipper of insertion element IS481
VSHATHSNAALTPRARLRLARLVVEAEWSPARAAERYDVSWKTAAKWAARYRAEGPAGMLDRSSRPHRQPNRTPAPVVRKIVHLRWKQRLGPVEIGDRLGVASSTVHAVLVRCRLNRLTHIVCEVENRSVLDVLVADMAARPVVRAGPREVVSMYPTCGSTLLNPHVPIECAESRACIQRAGSRSRDPG